MQERRARVCGASRTNVLNASTRNPFVRTWPTSAINLERRAHVEAWAKKKNEKC